MDHRALPTFELSPADAGLVSEALERELCGRASTIGWIELAVIPNLIDTEQPQVEALAELIEKRSW
ncbi:hypothetical protein GCM10029978_067790 [Actinoallomurus acanthiterrae]